MGDKQQGFFSDLFQRSLSFSKQAGDYILPQGLKVVYSIIFNIMHTLMLGMLVIAASSSQETRDDLMNFLKRRSSVPVLAITLCLLVVEYSLSKAYQKATTPQTRKTINLAQDAVLGTAFILAAVFLRPLIQQATDYFQMAVAYWVYFAFMVLYKVINFIKWAYYLFENEGKKNMSPWQAPVPKDYAFTKKQIEDLKELVRPKKN